MIYTLITLGACKLLVLGFIYIRIIKIGRMVRAYTAARMPR